MLTIVIAGRGRYVVGSEERAVGGGMVGLVAGDAHGVLMSDPGDPYIHYYTRFSGRYARDLADLIIAREKASFFPIVDALVLAERLHRHGHIRRQHLPPRCGPEGFDVLAILEELLRQSTVQGRQAATAPHAQRLRDFLFDRIAEPTDLDAMANALGVSRSSLSRSARRMGTTVQRLHEEIKIDWAATLLRTTNGAIAEVARRVGYHDQFYFSRVFRRHLGVSPRAYRTELRD